MFFSDASAPSLLPHRTHALVAALLGCALTLGAAQLHAQAANAAPPPATGASASTGGLAWNGLAPAEQRILQPLAASWTNLSEAQKRKWRQIANAVATRSQADQDKLHERMEAWVALSPREREIARLNYARTQALEKSERTAHWEAYQALSPQERKKLAAKGSIRPSGAAVALRPADANKLAKVAVTRNTPAEVRSEALARRPVDRNTLLPAPQASNQ